jgi:hypothetical protein
MIPPHQRSRPGLVRLFDLGNKKTRQGSAGCDRLQREVIAPDQLIL